MSLVTFLAELALVLLSEFAPQALSFASARTLSIASAGLLLLTALLVYDVPVQGLRDLFRLRPSLFTLGTLSSVLCIADTLSSEVSYCAPAALLLCCLERALLLRRRTMHRTLSTVCGFDHPAASPDFLKVHCVAISAIQPHFAWNWSSRMPRRHSWAFIL